MSESTVLCSECFLRQIFTFLPVPKSLWTLPLLIMAKKGRPVTSWKQMQCHRCIFFSFAPVSLRAPVSNGMNVDYEAEKGTALRESVQLTPVGQMVKPLTIESWRKARGCSASEVKFVQNPPIERPTRDVRPTRGVHVRWPCHTVEINPFNKLAFLTVYLASFFFSSTPLEDCSNLSLENPNLMNRSQNSP